MLESRISPHAGQLPGVQQLQRFRVWTKEYDGNLIKALEEFGKKIGMEYNRQRIFFEGDRDVVSLWRASSGFGTMDSLYL